MARRLHKAKNKRGKNHAATKTAPNSVAGTKDRLSKNNANGNGRRNSRVRVRMNTRA
jgi:hypothetical protein